VPVAAVTAAAYAVVLLVAAGSGQGNTRQFLSYVWQFYLPRLSFLTPKIGPPHYGVREAFTERLFGGFAQLEVVQPPDVAAALYWLCLAGLVALIVVLVVRRGAVRRHGAEAVVLGAAVVAMVLGLHLAAYRAMLSTPGDPIITARYILPLLPLLGTAIALVDRALPRRAAGAFCGLVLAGGVALQLESVGLLLERFYA
jgi:hypothetical protein